MQSAPSSLRIGMLRSGQNRHVRTMFFWWYFAFESWDARFPASCDTSATSQRTMTTRPKYASYTSTSHTSCFPSAVPMIWSCMVVMLMVAAGVADAWWWILLNASPTRLAAPGKCLIDQPICCSSSRCPHWQLESFRWLRICCSDGLSVCTDLCRLRR